MLKFKQKISIWWAAIKIKFVVFLFKVINKFAIYIHLQLNCVTGNEGNIHVREYRQVSNLTVAETFDDVKKEKKKRKGSWKFVQVINQSKS